jgi:metallo-beta-lactamase family protein
VKAEVRSIDSYSAHADYEELIRFLECQDKEKIKKLILVHGESKTQENFANTLRERGYENVYIPSKCETLVLD